MTDAQWREAWDAFRAAREDGASGDPPEVSTDPEVSDHVLSMIEEQEASSPQPHQKYGRYEIVAKLGQGGMGEVYSAQDTDLNRLIALKFLSSRMLGLPSAVDRMVREAKAASALNHPNIVTVYEVIRPETGLAIATELVEGAPLRAQCLAPQPVESVALWGEQIARGLAAAHSHGIVHGDIKPENIMLRGDGYVKIVDFGLARQIGAENSIEDLPLGTVGYMSPEQIQGKALTAASDVFSLGVVLYELVIGSHPFLAGSASATTRAIALLDPEALQHPANVRAGPRSLQPLLRSMLGKDPLLRPSALAVAAELQQQSKRTAGSVPMWRLQLAGAVLAAIAIALAAWTGIHRGEPAATPRVINFTSYEGVERTPSFSPDGRKVAFSWDGDGSNTDIYYKEIGQETPVRLTTDPAEDFNPIWSPDGSQIAFLRRVASEAQPYVMLIPAAGGQESIVGRIIDTDGFHGPICWWPDGQSLILRDDANGRVGLVRLILATGEKRILTTPPLDNRDGTATASSDGRRLAFIRYRSASVSLCLLPVAEGPGQEKPECVFSTAGIITGLAWQHDDKGIFYGEGKALWRLPIDGNRAGRPVRYADGEFSNVTADRQGHRLAADRVFADSNIWQLGRDGRASVKLISSSSPDNEPEYSPDGEKIVFRSSRTGTYELWTTSKNGSNPVRLTSFGAELGSARWSPDGKTIAFDGDPPPSIKTRNKNIYVVSAAGGPIRRVTDDTTENEVPGWSRDGRSIYYDIQDGSRKETWKIPLEGGTPAKVSDFCMFDIQESEDGYLYFTIWGGAKGIWRRRVEGGESQLIPGTGSVQLHRLWHLNRDGIYFAEGPANLTVQFFSFATARVSRVATLLPGLERGPRGMGVSPDGRSILVSRVDTVLGDIYLLEDKF